MSTDNLVLLTPNLAAREVCDSLIRQNPKWIIYMINNVYKPDVYDPESIGNAILSYGNICEWVRSKPKWTLEGLHNALKGFGIKFEESLDTGKNELLFVKALGQHLINFVKHYNLLSQQKEQSAEVKSE